MSGLKDIFSAKISLLHFALSLLASGFLSVVLWYITIVLCLFLGILRGGGRMESDSVLVIIHFLLFCFIASILLGTTFIAYKRNKLGQAKSYLITTLIFTVFSIGFVIKLISENHTLGH